MLLNTELRRNIQEKNPMEDHSRQKPQTVWMGLICSQDITGSPRVWSYLSLNDLCSDSTVAEDHTRYDFKSFKIYWAWFCGSGYGRPWYTIYGCLKRRSILLLLGRVFYKCQLDHDDWWCCWALLYHLLVCSLVVLSTAETGVLNFDCGFLSLFFPLYQFLFHTVGNLVHRHLDLSTWWNDPFIIIKCVPLPG